MEYHLEGKPGENPAPVRGRKDGMPSDVRITALHFGAARLETGVYFYENTNFCDGNSVRRFLE